MSEKQQEIDRVTEHVNALAEHFDTVQIFCTRHEAGTEDGTISINIGAGNWYARFGHVRDWCIQKDKDTRSSRRRDP